MRLRFSGVAGAFSSGEATDDDCQCPWMMLSFSCAIGYTPLLSV